MLDQPQLGAWYFWCSGGKGLASSGALPADTCSRSLWRSANCATEALQHRLERIVSSKNDCYGGL